MVKRFAGIVLALASQVAFSQEANSSGEKALIDELEVLLNTPVTVASTKASTIREQPGIVSLVTRQEIQASEARNLIDILHTVQGFSFGAEVQGVVGAASRGAWAYEGKMLLLVDSQELNDPLYGTTQLGNHIPVDLIQRIEIIRGPGSAIYGGHAELAVINVVTRGAEDLAGGYVGALVGQVSGTDGHTVGSFGYGRTFEGGKFSFSGHYGAMPRGNGSYSDWSGVSYDLSKQSDIRHLFSSLGLEYRGVEMRMLLDKYQVDHRDGFGDVTPNVVTQTWDNYYLDVKAPITLGVGVSNLLERPFVYPQAYFSPHHPIPGLAREFTVRCGLSF